MITIEIIDEPKARTRRKTFNYIREGNTLRHISKYSMKEIKVGDKKAWKIIYKVPFEKLQEKVAYEFSFTNRGGFGIHKFPATEFLKEKERNRETVTIDELQNIEFEIESDKVRTFIEEIIKFYVPMITEINEFKTKVGISIITSERVGDYLVELKWGLASNLCNWPEKARINSFKQTTKLLHQLWTLKILHEALGIDKIKRGWLIEQSSKHPASIFIDNQGNTWTCWFEPQKIKKVTEDYKGPLSSFFEGRVAWKRPDIIISRGEYDSLVETLKFDILIECKHLPFEEWWKNGLVIEEQLIPYKYLFGKNNPELLMVLPSLHSIPDYAKEKIREVGFLVIDNFYPGNKNIEEFIRIIKQKLR